MKRITVLIAIAVLLVATGSAVAQSDEEQAPPRFVEDLAALLEGGEFTGEEIAALVTAAQGLDWNGAEEADPAVVALALQMSESSNGEEDLEPLEQAQLALELALTAVEMENAGYEDRVVARAAIEGARQVTSRIQEWKREGEPENLGEQIRNTVRERVVEVARERGDADGFDRAEKARSRGSAGRPGSDEGPGSGAIPDTPGR